MNTDGWCNVPFSASPGKRVEWIEVEMGSSSGGGWLFNLSVLSDEQWYSISDRRVLRGTTKKEEKLNSAFFSSDLYTFTDTPRNLRMLWLFDKFFSFEGLRVTYTFYSFLEYLLSSRLLKIDVHIASTYLSIYWHSPFLFQVSENAFSTFNP